jgi:hypothetical protein
MIPDDNLLGLRVSTAGVLKYRRIGVFGLETVIVYGPENLILTDYSQFNGPGLGTMISKISDSWEDALTC